MFIYLFIEKEEKREKERERNKSVREKYQLVASHTPPTRDLARNLGMCPNQELNQRPFICFGVVVPKQLSYTGQGI